MVKPPLTDAERSCLNRFAKAGNLVELCNAHATRREKLGVTCSHPPHRLYSWVAFDGTLCVCCCECGAVLKGGC